MDTRDPDLLGACRLGFLAGAPIGAALAHRTAALSDPVAIRAEIDSGIRPLAPPAGRRFAAVALGDALIEELMSGGVDLRRLARRWTDWQEADGFDVDPGLAAALSHLREFDAPADRLDVSGPAALLAALPAALAASSPRSMVSGAFHTARLVDPDPDSGLAAVAVVLAAARFMEGQRDFIAEVLGLLRSNNAPPELFDRYAAIAREPRRVATPPRGKTASATEVALWVLRVVEHQPRGIEALEAMVNAGGVSPAAGAVLGALLGARDGIEQWPAVWRDGAGEDVVLRTALAATLAA
jgi:ADP-ribosylglycohydrolase